MRDILAREASIEAEHIRVEDTPVDLLEGREDNCTSRNFWEITRPASDLVRRTLLQGYRLTTRFTYGTDPVFLSIPSLA